MAATVPLDAEVARRWMVAVDVASVFIFVAIILANRRGHVTAARVTLVIGGLLLTSTNAIALGRESGADLLFVALLAVPFALFDLSERTPMVTGLVLTLLALVACACGVLSPTPLAPTGLRFYEAYSLVLAVVIVLFTLFQNSRENARVESALRLDIVARERAERELAESRQAAITAAKLAALGEMSASVAHEVNNPLSVILMRSQRLELLARAGKLDAPAVLKTASEINRTVDRIRRVVDALRAFARQREEDPLRPELLAPIVADTVELCEHRFRQRGVGLNVDPIPDGLQVLCRAAQIAQVLLNLLSNGYDAVENQSERWVRITVAADEQEVHIAVLDSGPGVPQEIAARIMEPFYTTKEIGRGTGLGLSLSEGIAAAHGGRLELDPRARPTRFVLTLKRAPARPA